ncbi:hypothetical protein JGUZn3_10040 [Entomobacter blattae]|uniref:Uncharacterized protein n=1 Tax=Entomobacter blattae TaxID=2762277 RepID=A0A7H1NR23_9PROT|nr:hypothetical protein JGUZn3_10040 [Entomobacter blattae]
MTEQTIIEQVEKQKTFKDILQALDPLLRITNCLRFVYWVPMPFCTQLVVVLHPAGRGGEKHIRVKRPLLAIGGAKDPGEVDRQELTAQVRTKRTRNVFNALIKYPCEYPFLTSLFNTLGNNI